MKNLIVFSLFVFILLLNNELAKADPTVLTRTIGGGPLLFGVRPSGMGGATLGVQSPATLYKIPAPAFTLDLGYSTLRMKSASGTDDATLPLYGAGFAVPLPNRWAVALKFLRLTTNDYNQQDNPFAPKGPEPFRASAEDFAVLAAVSKGLGEKFGLGLALALYGKSTYDIAANDNTRHYELLDRFSPIIFVHWQTFPELAFGGQITFINGVQLYQGEDFEQAGTSDVDGNPIHTYEGIAAHYEYKLGVAYTPVKGLTFAADGEYHFTDAPLHPLLGGHEGAGGHGIESQFDSFRWYAGVEKWFSFGLPVDILALRAGVLDEKSPTIGLTFRLKLMDTPVQIDYAFVRNHSIKEFDEFEPGLFGESSNSHGVTFTVLL